MHICVYMYMVYVYTHMYAYSLSLSLSLSLSRSLSLTHTRQTRATPLSEMSDDEAAAITIPDSFMPTFTSDVRTVPTARSLLERHIFSKVLSQMT